MEEDTRGVSKEIYCRDKRVQRKMSVKAAYVPAKMPAAMRDAQILWTIRCSELRRNRHFFHPHIYSAFTFTSKPEFTRNFFYDLHLENS